MERDLAPKRLVVNYQAEAVCTDDSLTAESHQRFTEHVGVQERESFPWLSDPKEALKKMWYDLGLHAHMEDARRKKKFRQKESQVQSPTWGARLRGPNGAWSEVADIQILGIRRFQSV